MTGLRRLSHAVAEGDGISILVEVADRVTARAAEAEGAGGLVVRGHAAGVREASQLPLLWTAGSFREAKEGGDAVVLFETAGDRLRSCSRRRTCSARSVVKVRDEEEPSTLERVDPEVLLLSAEGAEDGQHHLDRLLELLPDVPAVKLAIAELASAGGDDLAALERAGVNAVLLAAPGGG